MLCKVAWYYLSSACWGNLCERQYESNGCQISCELDIWSNDYGMLLVFWHKTIINHLEPEKIHQNCADNRKRFSSRSKAHCIQKRTANIECYIWSQSCTEYNDWAISIDIWQLCSSFIQAVVVWLCIVSRAIPSERFFQTSLYRCYLKISFSISRIPVRHG